MKKLYCKLKQVILIVALFLMISNLQEVHAETSDPLTFGTLYNYSLSGSDKYYQFELTQNGVITTDFTCSSKYYMIYLCDENLDTLKSVNVYKERLNFKTGLKAGTYYYKIIPLNSITGTLKVTFSANENCEQESNDSFSEANSISKQVLYDSFADPQGVDEDYFSFYLNAGEKIELRLYNLDESGVDVIYFYEPDRSTEEFFLRSSHPFKYDASHDCYVVYYTPTMAGKHYLRYASASEDFRFGIWPANYLVTFNYGDERNDTTKEVGIGQSFGKLPVPSRAGYFFRGWSKSLDESGLVTENTICTGDTKLFAIWESYDYVEYQIRFNGNGSSSGMMANQSFTYGKKEKLNENEFIKKGYYFVGWNTKANGKGNAYKNEQAIKNLSDKKDAVIKLYAQWKPNTYMIKFNANKGRGSMSAIKNVVYDKTVKLKKNTFKRSGYVFKGWSTKKNGKGKIYKNKASVKNLTTKNKGTVVLYAVWQKK